MFGRLINDHMLANTLSPNRGLVNQQQALRVARSTHLKLFLHVRLVHGLAHEDL